MIVDIFAAREISSKSCEWRAFFSHKKNTTQSMIVGDWKTTRFAWNTFHQWPKINNRWLRVIKKQLVLHEIFSNNGDQSMFFWQRKNNQTINDCGWLKTCSPCMEYLRLIVIKWCFFLVKKNMLWQRIKFFPKNLIEGCCRRKLGEVWLVSCWCTCLQTLSLSFFSFQRRRSLLFQSQIGW